MLKVRARLSTGAFCLRHTRPLLRRSGPGAARPNRRMMEPSLRTKHICITAGQSAFRGTVNSNTYPQTRPSACAVIHRRTSVAYTNSHLVVRLNGTFGASSTAAADKWSCGFRVAVPGGDIQLASPALLTFANAVHTAALALHNGALMLAGTSCFFQYVTVARVGTDGTYDPPSQVTTVSTGNSIVGSGTTVQPWSTAHSFGLRTDQPRGYASNGRMYYPFTGGSVISTTGRLNSTQVANRLSGMRTFINAVNVAANTYDAGAAVCVMSNVGAGTTARVLALRADERLDSIERRENDQPVNYTLLAL